MFWKRYAELEVDELVRAADRWAKSERSQFAEILGILVAMDEKKVAEAKGYGSLFQFCTERLRFSEAVAFWRIRTARAAKDFPIIIPMLEVGHVTITTVTLMAPYLDKANHEELLGRASGKSRKEVEALIASLQPSAPRRDVVVKCGPLVMAKAQWPEPAATAPGADAGALGAAAGALGPSGTAGGALSPGSAAAEQRALDVVEAIDAERRRLHFDVGPDTAQLLQRARDILRHKFPFASLEDIVREALNVLLDSKDLDRAVEAGGGGEGDGPRRPSAEGTRAIPMWVRRAVWRRDQGRCVFVGDGGRVCGERAWLEFDHVVPFAQGGRSDDPANVRLLCRAHNRTAADRAFGGGSA